MNHSFSLAYSSCSLKLLPSDVDAPRGARHRLYHFFTSFSLSIVNDHEVAFTAATHCVLQKDCGKYNQFPKDRTTALKGNGAELQKGGVPATPSGTATLLRLSPNYQFCPRSLLAVTNFRHPRLSWLDGRCVQGPGTYSPRHG